MAGLESGRMLTHRQPTGGSRRWISLPGIALASRLPEQDRGARLRLAPTKWRACSRAQSSCERGVPGEDEQMDP